MGVKRRRGRLAAALGLALAMTVGCSPAPPTPAPSELTWPAPPADRPVVELSFVVARDLRTATGTERLSFTPGAPVCEVVFRAWPNKPFTAAAGNALAVLNATVDRAPVKVRTEAGGAPRGSPGTLVTLPLAVCTTATQTLEIELDFTVALGADTDERIGYSTTQEVAWLGTAYPLLAWDGGGWAVEDAVPVVGESATSVAFRLASLAVTAPSRFEVAGMGSTVRATARPDGTTTHVFSAPVVRDVTFTVGELELVRRAANGLTVIVAVPAAESLAPATVWAEAVSDVTAGLANRFGPSPYDELWVSVLPGVTEGVEYPGAIQFGNVSPRRERWLLVHEVAHQWFYALVGNNQARHPWLDEAFANFAEQPASGADGRAGGEVEGVPGAVGRPMAFFAAERHPSRAYVSTVYQDGGQALLAARRDAGADGFDKALRRYLLDNAHRVATPDDLAEALRDLPEALAVLRRYGALATGETEGER